LRREELAGLAGVGVSWYTWLEQGRDIKPSAQVIDALARALRLSDAEHRHLFHLAGVERPLPDHAYARSAPHELRAIVEALAPHPAYLLGPRRDFLAWNHAAAVALYDFGRLPPERRNMLWWLFGSDPARRAFGTWEASARRQLANFRVEHARRPGDPSFTGLVEELSEMSPEFRRWWPRHEVLEVEPGVKRIAHPQLGPLDLLRMQVVPVNEPDLRLTVLVPGDDATRVALESLPRTAP